MSRCISRRAMPDKTCFKLSNGKTQRFSIFIEYQCPNEALFGNICSACYTKLPGYKYQANPKCDHGVVGGIYPHDSQLYGSPYYLQKVKEGWLPSEEDEQRAKDAMIKTNSQMPPAKDISGNVVVKKFRIKGSQPATTVTAALPENVPVAVTSLDTVLKKPRKPRTKPIIPVVEAGITNSEPVKVLEAKMVESIEAPINCVEVIRVKVKKIRHQSKDYYFDGNSGKLYEALAGGVGKYKGRYMPESQTLNATIPDSDEE